jgi:hypothetical protein
VRENRTHGSEGGDGESRFRPLSAASCQLVAQIVPTHVFSKEALRARRSEQLVFEPFVYFVVNAILPGLRLQRAMLLKKPDFSISL